MLFHFICLVVSFAAISLDAIQNCVTHKNVFSKTVFIRYLNYCIYNKHAYNNAISYFLQHWSSLTIFLNFTLIPSWGLSSSFGVQLCNIIRGKKYGIKIPFAPSLLLVFTHLLVIAHFVCSTTISSCSNSPQNVFLMFIYPFIQTGDI